MSRIRRNIEFYRLPTDVEADGTSGTENVYDRFNSANHIVEGTESRVYSGVSPNEIMTITQVVGGVTVRTSVYSYNADGTIGSIVTIYEGKTTTETFTYDGSSRITQIVANTV